MNNTAIIGIVVVVIIIIAAGAYLVTSSGSKSQYTTSVPATTVPTTAYTTVAASTSVAASTTVASNATTTVANTTNSSAPLIHYYTANVSYNASVGNYLTNSSGFTLYVYSKDTANSGTTACTGGCAATWPPFLTNISTLSVPATLSASSFNTIKYANGSTQLTYKGYPLYYFVGDTKAGQVSGNGVGGFFAATVPNVTT